MTQFVKGTLVEALLGAVLITVLLLPFQVALPQYAPYTPFLIVPIIMFFALRLPLGGLVALALSFLAGVVWGFLFAVVAGPMLAANPASAPLVLGVGITLVIFLILAVHPLLLGKTPLAMVPGVLLGFVESLMVMMVLSNVVAGPANPVIATLAPPGGLLAIAGFFLYGCVMTAIMVVVSGLGADAVAGKGWNPHRGAPQGAPQGPSPSAPRPTDVEPDATGREEARKGRSGEPERVEPGCNRACQEPGRGEPSGGRPGFDNWTE